MLFMMSFTDVPEGSFIVRAHTPMSNLFSCLWFNEVDRFTSRDQLSFAYTFLKLKRMNPDRPFKVKMFKVIYFLLQGVLCDNLLTLVLLLSGHYGSNFTRIGFLMQTLVF